MNSFRFKVVCFLCGILVVSAATGTTLIRPYFAEVRGLWLDDHAVVEWVTSDETGSAAFRLWQETADGKTLIEEGWQESDVFSRLQNTYRVVFSSVIKGQSETVWIEELTLDGQTRFWGPWKVVFEELPPPQPLADMSVLEVQWDLQPLAPSTGPAVKVPITSFGIYSVSFVSIASGLGLSVEDVAERATNALLHVHHEGESVAYEVDGDSSSIWFYGWPVTNLYTRTQYFWIEPGPGTHMEWVDPEPIPVGSNLTYRALVRYRDDLMLNLDHFTSFPEDFYFWRGYSATIPSWTESTEPVDMTGFAGGDLELTLHIEGINATAISPNHEAQISFNGVSVGSVFFDGRQVVTPTFAVAEEHILPHGNTVTIRANLLPGRPSSLFYLKHFDLAFDRYYEPRAVALPSVDGGNERLSADRFDDAVVLNISNPRQPVRIAAADGTVPAETSWLAEPDSSWFFQERASIQSVSAQPGGHGVWMRATTNRVDYLVITSRALEAPGTELADYRASQGLRTAVALYEEICDQFSYGLNTPEAIQSFLQFAHANWQEPPRMVLLAGWGHFDYLGVFNNVPPNHLPPLLAFDLERLRPADLLFADLTGNEVPDFSIGRLPVQTVAQFNDYISKLQAYESAGPQEPHQIASFFADDADAAGDFEETNAAMATFAAPRYTITTSTFVPGQIHAMRTNITHALRSGRGFLHYTGHGSFQQLADENFFNNGDVAAMTAHPPVPLFMSLTCYIGRFDHITVRSLAEVLLLKPQGGALAVYAPSGLSLNFFAEIFGSNFYEKHASGNYDTIGLALLATAQELGPPSGPLENRARRTYNLLGCPALKLQGAGTGEAPAAIDRFSLWRWERFSAAELADLSVSSAEAIPSGQEWNNFLTYAFGGRPPRVEMDLESVGPGLAGLEWIQRDGAADFSTSLIWTDDFGDPWQPVDPETVTFTTEESDPGLVRWRAELPVDVPRRYFRLRVKPN